MTMSSLWDGFNKRKYPRIPVTCDVVVEPIGKKQSFTVTTEDVGMGGLSVLLPEQLERFDRCKISIELRDGKSPVECIGRSVWIIPSHDPKSARKHYDTGLEFIGLDEASKLRLQIFLTPKAL